MSLSYLPVIQQLPGSWQQCAYCGWCQSKSVCCGNGENYPERRDQLELVIIVQNLCYITINLAISKSNIVYNLFYFSKKAENTKHTLFFLEGKEHYFSTYRTGCGYLIFEAISAEHFPGLLLTLLQAHSFDLICSRSTPKQFSFIWSLFIIVNDMSSTSKS